jgi:hypothetical protein
LVSDINIPNRLYLSGLGFPRNRIIQQKNPKRFPVSNGGRIAASCNKAAVSRTKLSSNQRPRSEEEEPPGTGGQTAFDNAEY